jgi:formylmethanofuran dehydrogenase subunit E
MPKRIHTMVKHNLIVGVRQKEFLMAIENFHGRQAPGLVLGGLMVDLGIELLGSFSNPAAVVETQCYLPDAVQLFTPCTVGNRRLVILDWGKWPYAFTIKTNSPGIASGWI